MEAEPLVTDAKLIFNSYVGELTRERQVFPWAEGRTVRSVRPRLPFLPGPFSGALALVGDTSPGRTVGGSPRTLLRTGYSMKKGGEATYGTRKEMKNIEIVGT